jgi:hypothetical protein
MPRVGSFPSSGGCKVLSALMTGLLIASPTLPITVGLCCVGLFAPRTKT